MTIIVDAFGGDNAPLEIIKGCEAAVKEFGAEIILTGKEDEIRSVISENGISDNGMTIINADSVITMEDDHSVVVKAKKDSSMAVGFSLLAEGKGDAFVSAGNTGAVLTGASLIVKRIKGIKRAALAPLIPTEKGPAMLIDCGANVENKPEYLMQFALMGSVYMNKIMGIDKPRVGLANNGTEETKGTQLHIDAHNLIKNAPVNFIGNIEGRDIPLGAADVVVADGFTGNIILKTIEGMGLLIISNLKEILLKNAFTKLAAFMLKNGIRDFRNKLDYTEYGGAPLMGISKPVIKAHGSSNAKSFKNAIKQAIRFSETGVIPAIELYMSAFDEKTGEN